MKWGVRVVDWVATVAMAGVVVAGGSVALSAWNDEDPPPVSAPAVDDAPRVVTSADDLLVEPRTQPAPSPTDRFSADRERRDRKGAHRTGGDQAGTARPKPQRAAPASPPPPPPAPVVHPVEVVVSSFNILGSSHTSGPHGRRGFGPGPVRARGAAQLVLHHGVDIVGFQEMQRNQMQVIDAQLGDRYAMFPGFSMSERESVNSIAWDVTKWVATESRTVSIPYFGGRPREMPVVQLENRANGARVWVGNFHNPADAHGPAQRWRDQAARIQIDLANRLIAEDDVPVIFTGDFNDRERIFCPLVGQTPLEASNGGSADGGCAMPPRPHFVDWIFGSGVEWLSHLADTSPAVRRTSDHPMIVARALLQPGGVRAAASEAAAALARTEAAERD